MQKEYKIVVTDIPLKGKPPVRLVCLLQQERLVEARLEPIGHESILGNIYVGRVQKVVKNLQAAFVEIAPGLSCYYPIRDDADPIFVKKLPSKSIVQGDEFLVQVEREGLKTKQPAVTTNLTLNGRFSVLTTQNRKKGVSSKLDAERKKELRLLLEEQYSDTPYGIILRTNAQHASEAEIVAEVDRLIASMDEMIQFARTRVCFSCVHKGTENYLEFLKNCREPIGEIVTDSEEYQEEIARYCASIPDLVQVPVRFYEDALLPIRKLLNLERQLEHALEPHVWLKSGGYLVIEPTEALTVIDVNTGKSMAKHNPQEHFCKINAEAAIEIARQIRLRNISGIIIIDFIDLDREEDKKQLMETLRREVSGDSVPVQVVDMTRLNLVEMTRKKREKSLKEQWEICCKNL